MEQLSDALDLPFHEGLVRPYDDLDRKMVDGIHRISTPMGDTRFLEHRQIDPSVASRWKVEMGPVSLGEPTRRLAAELGYLMEKNRPVASERRRQYAAQQAQRRRRRT